MTDTVLFISEKKYISSDIFGGVQLCTNEYIKYIKLAGYNVTELPVSPSISIANRLKIKSGIDSYNRYSIIPYLAEIVQIINSSSVKLVFLNQLDIAFWAAAIKKHVEPGVKFIGLSHGNESADYLHDITKSQKTSILQTWKLGRLLVKETNLLTSGLDGIIVLSEQEMAINQWLGADKILYLPRLLEAGFMQWKPSFPNAGFVGTLDHLPNALGIEYLAKELLLMEFPFQLQLVGGPVAKGKQLAKKYNFIQYKGPLSDNELIVEVKTWSVFLNPVFWYSRGASTKLAYAIKYGIPCITTPAGRRGYNLYDEAIVTTDNTPKRFAKTLIKALADPGYLSTLKKATDDNALNFSVQPYINQLKSFLNQLTGSGY